MQNQQKPTQGVVRNAQASGSGLTTNQTGKQRKRKQSKQQSSPNKQQDPAKTGQPQYIPQYWDSIRKRFVRVQR
ncbi:hypothetical protein BUALT_Bualt02G0007000 [Buddleja alternifolia]|uniref:Uncharacterized protein n=1 Tax=Buddleja alternifolia TaxID=168488 RepID=A0AAV6Y7M2_9LAMI|nr:hypothetical protein BUALT_Bualt02G0007000 [Buddleja alternifolia]